MKSLYRYILKDIFESKSNVELINVLNEETLNESFKSSILVNLANQIKEVEKDRNNREAELKRYNDEKGRRYKPMYRSFASIFSSNGYDKVLKIKWNEITDDDFTKYEGDNKELEKLIRASTPNSKRKGEGKNIFMIICKPGTKDITYVVKLFSNAANSEKTYDVYHFEKNGNTSDSNGVKLQLGYSFINGKTILELCKNADTYVVEIPKSMMEEVNTLIKNRDESKTGMINFDDDSLRDMKSAQMARYEVLVKELKSKKFAKDHNLMFGEIENIQKSLTELYGKIIGNAREIYLRDELGFLLHDVAECYALYYAYISVVSKDNELVQDKEDKDKKSKDNFEDTFRKRRSYYYNGIVRGRYMDSPENLLKEITDIISFINRKIKTIKSEL